MLWNKSFLNPFLLPQDYDICEHASISKHEFLQKLKVNHTESVYREKYKKTKGIKRMERTQKKQIDFYISP